MVMMGELFTFTALVYNNISLFGVCLGPIDRAFLRLRSLTSLIIPVLSIHCEHHHPCQYPDGLRSLGLHVVGDVVGNVRRLCSDRALAANLGLRLFLDSVVLALVWYNLRKLFADSYALYPSPLIRLLLRDGKSLRCFFERKILTDG